MAAQNACKEWNQRSEGTRKENWFLGLSQQTDTNWLQQSLLSRNNRLPKQLYQVLNTTIHLANKFTKRQRQAGRDTYPKNRQHGVGDQQITVPPCQEGLQARKVSVFQHSGVGNQKLSALPTALTLPAEGLVLWLDLITHCPQKSQFSFMLGGALLNQSTKPADCKCWRAYPKCFQFWIIFCSLRLGCYHPAMRWASKVPRKLLLLVKLLQVAGEGLVILQVPLTLSHSVSAVPWANSK